MPRVQMTRTVKATLLFLRLYLLFLIALIVYKFLTQIRLT
jgi:hypothetical protein